MLNTNTRKLLKLEGGMNFSFGGNTPSESRKDFRSGANDGQGVWVDTVSELSMTKEEKLNEVNKEIETKKSEILKQEALVLDLKSVKVSNAWVKEDMNLFSMKRESENLESKKKSLLN